MSLDGRGTGFKGRAFRALVTKQLGKLEAEDQVNAARYYGESRSYVDAEHITIWGWSYGWIFGPWYCEHELISLQAVT